MPTPRRQAVIITAVPLERDAVLEHLREVREEPPLRGSVYRKGIFDERSNPWEVVVAEIGAGNEGAAAEAERVIAHYTPEVAVFVGVAGAIKDLEHGDVVASTKVYAYESGKDRRSGFEVRPSVQLPAYALEQRARHEAGESDWRLRIKRSGPSGLQAPPSAKVGPITAGEKVLASNRTPIYTFIREHYGDAVAVEMEGHGFLLGVRMNHPTQGIVVRGISDKISNKRPTGDAVWQPVAARHAAAFAFQILAKLDGKAGDRKVMNGSATSRAVQIVAALVLPIMASIAAGHVTPSWGLALSGTGALLAVLCSLGIVLKVQQPWWIKAPVASLALLAYAAVMSFVPSQALKLPGDAAPDDKLAAAITELLAPGIYDREPVNLITVTPSPSNDKYSVDLGRQPLPLPPQLNLIVDITWTKRDGFLKRVYSGKVHYRGPLDGVSSHDPREFELVGYSLKPQSSVVAYLIGFVEIHLMMTKDDHVLREQLLDAVRKAQG